MQQKQLLITEPTNNLHCLKFNQDIKIIDKLLILVNKFRFHIQIQIQIQINSDFLQLSHA